VLGVAISTLVFAGSAFAQQFPSDTSTQFRIRNEGANKCAEVVDQPNYQGTIIPTLQLKTCAPVPAQHFTHTENQQIKNFGSDQCLTPGLPGPTVGGFVSAKITTRSCEESDFARAQQYIGDSEKRIKPKNKNPGVRGNPCWRRVTSGSVLLVVTAHACQPSEGGEWAIDVLPQDAQLQKESQDGGEQEPVDMSAPPQVQSQPESPME
jgi:hypothetical protein